MLGLRASGRRIPVLGREYSDNPQLNPRKRVVTQEMRPMLRKLRGALGTALTWAVAWAVAGVAIVAFMYVWVGDGWPDEFPFWEFARVYPLRLGLYGLMSGTLFAGALATIHRRRALGELKPAWVGLWGGLAGFLISAGGLGIAVASAGGLPLGPVPVGALLLGLATIFGGLGAATAVGTIMLAKAGAKEIESSDPGLLQPTNRLPRPTV